MKGRGDSSLSRRTVTSAQTRSLKQREEEEEEKQKRKRGVPVFRCCLILHASLAFLCSESRWNRFYAFWSWISKLKMSLYFDSGRREPFFWCLDHSVVMFVTSPTYIHPPPPPPKHSVCTVGLPSQTERLIGRRGSCDRKLTARSLQFLTGNHFLLTPLHSIFLLLFSFF